MADGSHVAVENLVLVNAVFPAVYAHVKIAVELGCSCCADFCADCSYGYSLLG